MAVREGGLMLILGLLAGCVDDLPPFMPAHGEVTLCMSGVGSWSERSLLLVGDEGEWPVEEGDEPCLSPPSRVLRFVDGDAYVWLGWTRVDGEGRDTTPESGLALGETYTVTPRGSGIHREVGVWSADGEPLFAVGDQAVLWQDDGPLFFPRVEDRREPMWAYNGCAVIEARVFGLWAGEAAQEGALTRSLSWALDQDFKVAHNQPDCELRYMTMADYVLAP